MCLKLLESVFIFCCIAANLFVLKQVELFGLEAAIADSVAAMLLNILQYDPNFTARKLIETGFIILSLIAINSIIHLNYLPSAHDFSQGA